MSAEVEGRKLRNTIFKFDSETLSSSSPIKVDTNSEKRVHKKRIRSTQDFNQLSSSFTLQDSEESAKKKSKKTKKSKKIYNLPRISKLAEDLSSNPRYVFTDDELVQNKRTKRKNKRINRKILSDTNNEHDRKSKDRNKEETFEGTFKASAYLKKIPAKDGSGTDEYQSASSMLDSQEELDEEIEIKTKRKLRKRNCNENNVNIEVENVNSAGRYAKRIKKLLSDSLIRSSKSNNTSNSSVVSTPLTDKKSVQGTNQIKPVIIPTSDRLTVCKDNQGNMSGKRSLPTRRSRKIYSTPQPKAKISNGSLVNCKENRKQSDTIIYTRTNRSPKPESKNVKNKNISRTSNFTVNVSFDMDYDSDEVFNKTFEGGQADENNVLNTTSKKTRKSVRFQSLEGNNKKNVILPNLSTEHLAITPKDDHCEDVTTTHNIPDARRSSTDSKRNSTFEITSPKVINKSHSNSVIDLVSNTPLNKIKLTTPKSKKTYKLVNTSVQNNVEVKSNALQVDNVTVTNTSSLVPNMVRTATFIKDDEAVKQLIDLPPDLKYSSSPLPSNTSYSKVLDTTKVNKRRRWDKSRPSISFLNDSLDIGNISAPWNDSIRNISNLEATPQTKGGEEKNNIQINNSVTNKVSFRNCATPPSGTSTPFSKCKSTLLRQALVKDKQNAMASEHKNRSIQKEKPPTRIVRTKIPNFALIHQRAYDKLENLKEMSDRKAARAKLLLSGHKPPSDVVQKTSTRRKELKFNSPIKSSSSNDNITKTSAQPSPARMKPTLCSSNKNGGNNKTPKKLNISVTKIEKISPSKSNPKVIDKENKLVPMLKKKELLKAKSAIPKPKLPNAVVAENKGFTRFGFKIGSEGTKKTTKEEQIKAITNKSKIMKNKLEERRNAIQGVRTNRRFDLLMKMRTK